MVESSIRLDKSSIFNFLKYRMRCNTNQSDRIYCFPELSRKLPVQLEMCVSDSFGKWKENQVDVYEDWYRGWWHSMPVWCINGKLPLLQFSSFSLQADRVRVNSSWLGSRDVKNLYLKFNTMTYLTTVDPGKLNPIPFHSAFCARVSRCNSKVNHGDIYDVTRSMTWVY